MHCRFVAGVVIACAVAGCGGGDSPSEPPAPPPTVTPMTLTVQTVDTDGRSIPDVALSLNGRFNGMSRTTGADGKASFDFPDAPAGEALVSTWSSNHHSAHRRLEIVSLPGRELQLTVLRLEQATPKVTGTATTISADAATLTIESEVSVTDEHSRSIDTLTLADFRAVELCDGRVVCIVEPSGQDSIVGYSLAPGTNPLSATLAGTAPAAFYPVRVVLNAAPGTFAAGRTVNTALMVRLGSDTWAELNVPVRLRNQPTAVADHGSNVVSDWSQIASATIAYAAAPRVTEEERRSHWALDHATVHAAMYDAVMAVAKTHKPFAITPAAATDGASVDAAAAAAAYGVLRGLFPNFSAVYQAAYDAMLAAMPDGDGKTRGLAIGAEVAGGMIALRAHDGRWTPTSYVPGTEPGKFRGVNPVAPWFGSVRPFTLTSASQFRAAEPLPLTSTAYADDFKQTNEWGGAASALRSPDQTAAAWFYSEAVNVFWPRNLRQFARSQTTVAENARLMAVLWITVADSAIGCFESKYHYLRWQTTEAIALADTDGNAATGADASWSRAAPTPVHPEYPAAPGCVVGTVGDTLARFFGTRRLVFRFDSTANGGSVRGYDSVDAMENEALMARIWGGAHFHTSLVRAKVLGAQTAHWVAKQHFAPVAR
jgi:hypothetical protein